MTASQKCSECQAVNAASAQWCTQCYASFAPKPRPVPPRVETPDIRDSPKAAPQAARSLRPNTVPRAPSPSPAAPASGGPTELAVEHLSDAQIAALLANGRLGEPEPVAASELAPPPVPIPEGSTWTCGSCETVNPLSGDACNVCGISIFDGFGADAEERRLSLSDATAWAILPGAGHMKMGQGVLGFIIMTAVVSLWLFGIWLVFSGEIVSGLSFVLVAIAVLVVSVIDARTIASGGAKLWLQPRTLSVIFGASIVGIMAVVWLNALA